MDNTKNELIRAQQPTEILSEAIISTDSMYSAIHKTLAALTNITVDGESKEPIDTELQAYPYKKLLPDTETEMLHTKAVPMSDEDIKNFVEMQRRRTSVQYRKEQLSIPTKTLAEITGARVRIAYRLARYMSHIRGIGEVGDPLIYSMASSNAQINLFELPIPYEPTVGWYRGLAAVRNLLAQSNECGYKYSYLLSGEYYITHGMSILPPPLHDGYYPVNGKQLWEYRREMYTPKNYKAEMDGPLATYLNICELLIRHLGIAEEDVEEQATVAALLNPSIARIAWPCRDDLETFEEYVLFPYIGRVVVDKAQDAAIEELKKSMRLTHAEAFDLVEAYKTYSREVNVFDPEKERSIMLSRLSKLAQTCGDADMVTTQLNTFKTQLQVLGLTKQEEDTNIDKRAGLSSILEAEIVPQTSDEVIGIAETERSISGDGIIDVSHNGNIDRGDNKDI